MSAATTAPQPMVLTKREAAELLTISVASLDRLIANGDIRAKRIGPRRVVITTTELDRYLAE